MKRRSRFSRRSRPRHADVTGDPCRALIDDHAKAKSYSGLRRPTTTYGTKQCPRTGREQVKHLWLCPMHARMARTGLVDESGRVASRADIQTIRRYPKKFPRGLYHWAQDKR